MDAIIGSSELLLEDADGPGQADFIANLSLIHSAGRQLLEIINDLLDTSKFASGDVVFNLASLVANLHYKVRLPINDVIGSSETLLENAAEQGRLDLIADLKKIQSAASLRPLLHQRNYRFFQNRCRSEEIRRHRFGAASSH